MKMIILLTYIYNVVDVVFLAVFHILFEHFFALFKIKFGNSANAKIKRIGKPWIYGYLIMIIPILKLFQNAILIF